MTATASDTSLPWDSERDWDDCYIDKYLKCRKRSNEKRAVFLQEKFDECTTDEGKILLRIEINEAVSKSASFCQEYFDRTGIHLPPMYKGDEEGYAGGKCGKAGQGRRAHRHSISRYVARGRLIVSRWSV